MNISVKSNNKSTNEIMFINLSIRLSSLNFLKNLHLMYCNFSTLQYYYELLDLLEN